MDIGDADDTDIPRGGVRVLTVLVPVTITVSVALLISQWRLRVATRALAAGRQELEHLLLSVPKIIWRAGPDGVPDLVNKRFATLTGVDLVAPGAVEFQHLVHPDDINAVGRSWAKAKASRRPFQITFRLRHADGGYRWMSATGRPAFSTSGDLLRWYGGISDIDAEVGALATVQRLNATLEQRVEERTHDLTLSEARYRRLFEVSNVSFCEQDIGDAKIWLDELKRDGVTDFRAYVTAHPEFLDRCVTAIKTVEVNEALARLLGYQNCGELAAKPPRENAETAVKVLTDQLEAAFHGWTNIEGTTVLIGKDDRRIPVLYTVRLVSDTRQVSSHIDLTERERIEALRTAAQAELARSNRIATVGALSTSLAHELNQPIAAIMTDAGTGVRWLEADPPNTDGLRRVLRRLEVNGKRLADIVQRTRDQLVKGTRTASAFDLGQLIAETKDLLERDLTMRQSAMTVACPHDLPQVIGDRVEVRQVLVNLLMNGLDAMAAVPASQRQLSVAVGHGVNGMIRVAVADTGPGIAEEDMAKLFQPFFTTKPGGMGIGLQICRTAVEAMGGTLKAGNNLGGGAVFTFTVPAVDIPHPVPSVAIA
ncbi:ATP-binding protein [Nitrospirillum sp. BR 11164]|uniref:PAS domain-containing sensor histidine kinase n=1 Tax=Nitrospirillum sp. BR 11164 TaxID=3104324 RepID=UPI002AFFE13F|nr:ATP-binding protein [Nitrospirillum sp. BR 11164]MEA1648027.1 ATP-binding protein [Nitrospirillum sp. BR 11164]